MHFTPNTEIRPGKYLHKKKHSFTHLDQTVPKKKTWPLPRHCHKQIPSLHGIQAHGGTRQAIHVGVCPWNGKNGQIWWCGWWVKYISRPTLIHPAPKTTTSDSGKKLFFNRYFWVGLRCVYSWQWQSSSSSSANKQNLMCQFGKVGKVGQFALGPYLWLFLFGDSSHIAESVHKVDVAKTQRCAVAPQTSFWFWFEEVLRESEAACHWWEYVGLGGLEDFELEQDQSTS